MGGPATSKAPVAGTRFGRITIIAERATGSLRVLGRCDCGAEKLFFLNNLRQGTTKSCGCLLRELITARNLRHGMTESPEFETWIGILQRCTNPNAAAYANYGGRGITVCERWRDSFENFYADMGPRPEGLSIDRIDNDGNYEPGNCHWATPMEQRHNQRPHRLKSRCKHGHEFTPENTRIRSDGARACLTCAAQRRTAVPTPVLDGRTWTQMPAVA